MTQPSWEYHSSAEDLCLACGWLAPAFLGTDGLCVNFHTFQA